MRTISENKVHTIIGAVIVASLLICAVPLIISEDSDAATITIDSVTYTTSGSTASATQFAPGTTQVTILPEVEIDDITYTVVAVRQSTPYCTTLIEVDLPVTLTSIGSSAFRGCTGLTEIIIPIGVTSIDNYAFYNCSGLTEIIIPGGVTSIGTSAFYGCRGLTEIIIPGGVTLIGNYAFQGCTGLTEIIIPISVKAIGDNAFSGCTGLTEFVIPSSVVSVSYSAFYVSSLVYYLDGFTAFTGTKPGGMVVLTYTLLLFTSELSEGSLSEVI